MRIYIEDYYGNDIVVLHIKNTNHTEEVLHNIIETDEYNIADVDEDENGEYVRVQLNTSTTMYKLNK